MAFNNHHVLESTQCSKIQSSTMVRIQSVEPLLFCPNSEWLFLLTAAPRVSFVRIRNIPQVFPCRSFSPVGREAAGFSLPLVLSGWKRGIAGVQAQPHGLRPNPTF